MREILFRGKNADTGEWVYGSTIIAFANGEIHNIKRKPIYPNTFCQYTGLCDIKGQKIFENDIMFDKFGTEEYWKIEFNDGSFNMYLLNHFKNSIKELPLCDYLILSKNMYVVGNIFDNPDPWKEVLIEE